MGGAMTNAKVKKFKEALNRLIDDIWAKSHTQKGLGNFEALEASSKLGDIIQVQER